MVQYNNNQGVGAIGRGGEIENSRFLDKHVSFIHSCEQ